MKNHAFLFNLSLFWMVLLCPQIHAGNSWDSVLVDRIYRKFLVHLPKGYTQETTEKVPLILFFHGHGGTAKGSVNYTRFDLLSDSENFIVVFPEGYKKSWADGRESTEASLDDMDDIKFVDLMLDKLLDIYRIDDKRVYAGGISNGGFMTQTLACNLTGRFAAIASVVASLPKNLDSICSPYQPIGILMICGTADPLVPFEGGRVRSRAGGEILGMEATFKKWAKFDGCNAMPLIENIPDKVRDGTTVVKYSYSKCNNNVKVVMFKIIGGGHQYPGSRIKLPFVGRLCSDIDASKEMWDFFKDQRLE